MIDALQIRATAILQAVSVFELLREIGHGGEFHGEDTQQMRCPIHEDRKPSARLYAPEGTTPGKVYCFTCATNWDVIDLVRAKYGYGFVAALDWLETRFTVPPPSANLHAKLSATLRRPPPATPWLMLAMTEQRLLGSARTMGAVRYTRALQALDLATHRFTRQTLALPELMTQLEAILAYTR